MDDLLDKKSWKLLKKLYKKNMTYKEVSKITGKDENGKDLDREDHHSDPVQALKKKRLIDAWTGPPASDGYPDEWFGYYITQDGRAYVEQRHRESRKIWIPVIVAAVTGLLTFLAALIS